MLHKLLLTPEPIDESALLAARKMSTQVGAAIYFVGVVRGLEGGQPITALEYESFQRMAEHQFALIFQEIEKRWPIESVRVVHRLGPVKVNEPSLWIEVLAGHREEAFAACEYLVNEMKRLAPIWKKPLRR